MDETNVTSVSGVSPSGDRKNRRSKGSKQKAAERYRSKANEHFQREFNTSLANKLLALGATADDLFNITKMDNIVIPDQQIIVEASKGFDLCDELAASLYSYGIAPPPGVPDPIQYDVWTLKYTLALQIEAKMFSAQKDGRFQKDLFDFDLVQRTTGRLNSNFVPLCAYLNHFGSFMIDGQRFFPKAGPNLITYNVLKKRAQAERRKTTGKICTTIVSALAPSANVWVQVLDPDAAIQNGWVTGEGALTENFYTNAEIILSTGNVIKLCEPEIVIPSFDDIVRRFEDLVTRATRKLPRCTVAINLSDGVGSAAQLVGYSQIGITERYRVWSPRRISDDLLEIGGIFQYACDQPMLDFTAAAISTEVETGGCLQILSAKLK